MSTTATDHRKRAAQARRVAADSFARSDTDGAATQWTSSVQARKHDLAARIADQDDRWAFPALFDLDGNLVAAKRMETRFGTTWALLASDNPRSSITGWVHRSIARSATARNAAMAKHGYTEGTVLAPAVADLAGSGTGLSGALSVHPYARRTDGGFSRDVEIVSTIQTEDWA